MTEESHKEALQIYLKEYEVLRDAVEKRVEYDNQILLYAITFTGTVLAVTGTFLNPGQFQSSPPIVVLAWLIPAIYTVLAFLSLRHIIEIVEIIYYVNAILRTKIIALVKVPVLGWDTYTVTSPKVPGFLLWPLYAARLLLFVMPSFLSTIFFAFYGWELFLWPIVVVGTLVDLALIFIIILFYLIAFMSWRGANTWALNNTIL